VTTPFDAAAPSYAALWSDTPNGRAQREQVWRAIGALFRPGDRVLDLGCGTGDDALHLEQRGVQVTGIDASRAMVGEAVRRGVDARCLAIEDLARLDAAPFDGALSNFAALNCVAELEPVAAELARRIVPGGFLALCVFSRFYPREWLARPSVAWARARGRATWRGMPVYYRSARQMRRAFAPHFRLVSRQSIGGGDHILLVFERLP
jgi:SAM-dependent methyltransferase